MISIKQFLNSAEPLKLNNQPEADDLVTVTIDSYRSVLRAIGKSAVQVCPAPGHELDAGLAGLEASLSKGARPKAIRWIEIQVEALLTRWGSLTAEHLKAKTDEIKDLLVMLARIAESVGERDQRYTCQFVAFTADLKTIASLDDLTQVRASLVRKATELKNCVDQMAQDGQDSLAKLRTKLVAYETRLMVAEQLANRDSLTGMTNRRGVEARLEWLIAQGDPFYVVMLDLNLFKRVNDEYGHAEGDDLLRKFADELRRNVRSEDVVGRWGGDEFILVLTQDRCGVQTQIGRIRDWVFGKYEIQTNGDKLNITMDVSAAVGQAAWLPGMTVGQLLAEADASMYLDKRTSRNEL